MSKIFDDAAKVKSAMPLMQDAVKNGEIVLTPAVAACVDDDTQMVDNARKALEAENKLPTEEPIISSGKAALDKDYEEVLHKMHLDESLFVEAVNNVSLSKKAEQAADAMNEFFDEYTNLPKTERYFSEEYLEDNLFPVYDDLLEAARFYGSLKEDIDTVFEIPFEEIKELEPIDSIDMEETPLAGPATGADTGVSNMLIAAINDEWEAIQFYNDLKVNLMDNNMEEYIEVVEDILSEENKHVGQLQKILSKLSPNVKEIAKGEEEAAEQIGETV